MNHFVGFLSVFSFISCILLIGVIIWKLREYIKTRYLLYGILVYFLLRIVIYPILYNIVAVDVLWVKLIFDFMYLVICFIFVKKAIVKKLLKDDLNKSNLISIGFGEGLSEFIFTIFPTLLNYFLFFILHISNQLDSYFQNTYSKEEINQFLTLFDDLPVSYFIYMIIITLSLLLFQTIGTTKLLQNDRRMIVVAIMFYLTYIVLSVFNYALACIILIMIDLYLLKNIRRGFL